MLTFICITVKRSGILIRLLLKKQEISHFYINLIYRGLKLKGDGPMLKRRMAYRLPEEKYEEVIDKLTELGLSFEEFIEKTIDLYLDGKINPKTEAEGWGNWMDE